MNRIFRRKRVFELGLAVFALLSFLPAWTLGQTPVNQGPLLNLVLLKNTNILEGIVHADLEKTVIETISGSRIVVPTDQVQLICDHYSEALNFLASSPEYATPEKQAELVTWCLRYKQLDLAQTLIDRLQFSRLSPQVLEEIHRRFTSAQQVASSRVADIRALPPANPPVVKSDPVNPRVEVMDRLVQQTNFEVPASNLPTRPPTPSTGLRTLPLAELEKKLKHVPDIGLAGFKRLVEPILIKNCAAAGCHHKTQSKLPLLELGHEISVPKRMSQQNLYQVMHYIGSGSPEDSLLLKTALSAHGGQKVASFAPNSREHELLKEWIGLMIEPVKLAKIPQEESSNEPDQEVGENQKASEPSTTKRATPPPSSIPPSSLPLPAIPDLKKKKNDSPSQDPFDPEVFNREHLIAPSNSVRDKQNQ